ISMWPKPRGEARKSARVLVVTGGKADAVVKTQPQGLERVVDPRRHSPLQSAQRRHRTHPPQRQQRQRVGALGIEREQQRAQQRIKGHGLRTLQAQSAIDSRTVNRHLEIPIDRPGLHEITKQVEKVVTESGVDDGLCTVFVQHTSAGLIVNEGADPSVRRDLEAWLARLTPEGDELYTHNDEGP